MKKLPVSYYLHEDVVFLARDLIGKYLFTNIGGQGITGGIITETEAYAGPVDKASHAFGYRRTSRTLTMFLPGGVSYVYLCYGIHYLFNVVTNHKDIPHAILIRGIRPTHGISVMQKRSASFKKFPGKLNGPGKLTRALGINKDHDSEPLTGNTIWIASNESVPDQQDIISTPRIGVDYAQDHALWPWRFVWKYSK